MVEMGIAADDRQFVLAGDSGDPQIVHLRLFDAGEAAGLPPPSFLPSQRELVVSILAVDGVDADLGWACSAVPISTTALRRLRFRDIGPGFRVKLCGILCGIPVAASGSYPISVDFEALLEVLLNNGRAGGIRTHDPLPPRQVRYQTALQPVSVNGGAKQPREMRIGKHGKS